MKNISLPSQNEYIFELIFSVETFVKNIRWRAHFFSNPDDKTQKENFGFKTLKSAPKVKELQKLEDRLYDIVRNVKFKKYSNAFLRRLKDDRERIRSEDKLIIPADKSSNYYSVGKTDCNELALKEIHKHHKKASENEIKDIKAKHTELVTCLLYTSDAADE